MPRTDFPDVHVLLRSCGERTLDACLATLHDQIDARHVTLINERPFSVAVERTFELAAEAYTQGGARWIIAIDADILLTRDGLAKMIELCEQSPREAFKINGVVLCHIHGGYCFRGVHAYRGSLTPQAAVIARRQRAAEVSLRPETAVGVEMERRGHPFAVYPRVVGIHDFEQSFKHLYLKMLLRARKSEDRAWLRGRLSAMAELSDDFLVSMWGFDDAVSDEQRSSFACVREYDWLAEYPALERHMREHGLSEKPPMPAALGVGYAEAAIAGYRHERDGYTPPWIRKALGLAKAPDSVPVTRT